MDTLRAPERPIEERRWTGAIERNRPKLAALDTSRLRDGSRPIVQIGAPPNRLFSDENRIIDADQIENNFAIGDVDDSAGIARHG